MDYEPNPDGDPIVTARNLAAYHRKEDSAMTTTTRTRKSEPGPALAELARIVNAEGLRAADHRRRSQRLAEQSRDELRAMAEAEDVAAGRKVDALRIIRALMNVDAPPILTESREEYDGRVWYGRVAMAHARATISRGSNRKNAPAWHSYGWAVYPDRDAVDLYRPAAGTNDPRKLADQEAEAVARALDWLDDYTATAWLRDHGIAYEAIGPDAVAELVTVEAYARGDYNHPGAYAGSVTLSVGGRIIDGGLQLAELRGFDIAYGLGNERRPVMPEAMLAELHALTRGNVPVRDLPGADGPAERERRLSAIRALLSGPAAPHIVRAWLAGFRMTSAD